MHRMRPLRTNLADAGLALAATLAWTWPLAPRIGAVLRDRWDGRTQAWVVAWVSHALRHAPADVFQANAFAPARDVLAFSEPLIGYGALAVPFSLLGLGPVAVLNLLCILGLAFSAFSLARLATELGAPRDAAALGSAAASFGALATVQLGFVSFTAWGGIAWCVLFGLRLLRGGGRRDAALLALSTGLLGWFSLHLLAFALAALLAISTCATAFRPRDVLGRLPRLVLALVAAGVLLAPLAATMIRVKAREGFVTSEADARAYSAFPASWLATTSHNPGQAFLPFRSGSEKALYPGSAALALSLAGLVLFRRSPRGRLLAATGGLLAILGLLGSLGPRGPLLPLLSRLAPPLWGGIRAAARFGFVTQIGVGLLAALGAARLLDLAPSRRARGILAVALLAGIAIDVRQSFPFQDRPAPPPPVESFLALARAGGPILHLPVAFDPSEAEVLLDSTAHFKPVVNGTLSHIPARFFDLAVAFSARTLPDDLVARLESWPVGTLVVHEHRLSLEQRAILLPWLEAGLRRGRFSGPLVFVHRGGWDVVLGVVRVRGSAPWGTPGGGDEAANAALLSQLRGGGAGPDRHRGRRPAGLDRRAFRGRGRDEQVLRSRLGPGRVRPGRRRRRDGRRRAAHTGLLHADPAPRRGRRTSAARRHVEGGLGADPPTASHRLGSRAPDGAAPVAARHGPDPQPVDRLPLRTSGRPPGS